LENKWKVFTKKQPNVFVSPFTARGYL
jgi:hypothetical protein